MTQATRISNNVFSITTGDGKVFNDFNWSHKGVNIPINGKVYNYPDRSGSKADRRLLKSPIYDIEFWIGGDDANASLAEFLLSTKDLNKWTIDHPVFGLLIGHPVGNIGANPQRSINGFLISFTFVESNIDEAVTSSDNTLDRIASLGLEADFANQEIYERTTKVQVTDRTSGLELTEKLQGFLEKVAVINDSIDELENLADEAFAAVDKIVQAPAAALGAIQNLMNLPGSLKAKLSYKLDVYTNTFTALKDIFNTNSSDSAKSLGAVNYASAVQNMAANSVVDASPDTESVVEIDEITGVARKSSLSTPSEITAAIELIIDSYNDYIIYFDEIGATSTETAITRVAGIGFKLNETTIENLREIVLISTTNLISLLRNANPESTHTVFEKISPINLVVQLYGYYDEDKFNEFVSANNLKANELIEVPINREVLYYP